MPLQAGKYPWIKRGAAKTVPVFSLCVVQLPVPWFLTISRLFSTPYLSCCPSKASSTISILPQPCLSCSLLLILPLCSFSAASSCTSGPVPYPAFALAVPLFGSLYLVLLSSKDFFSLLGCAACATLSPDSQANCPGSRSLQPGHGWGLSCSGTTCESEPGQTPRAAAGPLRASGSSGSCGPGSAAGTAPQPRARPARPRAKWRQRWAGACGQRCLPAGPHAASGFSSTTGWSGDIGPRAGDEPASSTKPRSALRERRCVAS